MASIREEITVDVNLHAAWRIVRIVENPRRLFPNMLSDARMDGDARVVTFVDGTVLRELIVGVDDVHHRIAYASVGGSVKHHNASIEVVPHGAEGSRLIWITDVLPDDVRDRIAGLMQKGLADAKATLERSRPSS